MERDSMAIRGTTWSADDGLRWHRRWARWATVFGFVGFLLPQGDSSDDLSWEFLSASSKSVAEFLLMCMPAVFLVALVVIRSASALRRGVVLSCVAALGLVLVMAQRGGITESQLLVTGCFLLAIWAAASAHSADRFHAWPRFRIPMLLSAITMLIATTMLDKSFEGQGPFRTHTIYLASFGLPALAITHLLGGLTGKREALRPARWLARIALFSIPVWMLSMVVEYPFNNSISWDGFVWTLKPALLTPHVLIVVGLAFANLGDHAAREKCLDNFAVDIFD